MTVYQKQEKLRVSRLKLSKKDLSTAILMLSLLETTSVNARKIDCYPDDARALQRTLCRQNEDRRDLAPKVSSEDMHWDNLLPKAAAGVINFAIGIVLGSHDPLKDHDSMVNTLTVRNTTSKRQRVVLKNESTGDLTQLGNLEPDDIEKFSLNRYSTYNRYRIVIGDSPAESDVVNWKDRAVKITLESRFFDVLRGPKVRIEK